MGTTAKLRHQCNDVVINAPSPAAGASTLSAVAASVTLALLVAMDVTIIRLQQISKTVASPLNDSLALPVLAV